MNKEQLGGAERRLRRRAEELREDIRRELRKYDDETYARLAEEVSDSGDQSLAALLSDVDLAEVTRDVGELREIDLALQRLAEGNYGVCIDCGEQIPPERLEANPSAVRCIADQERFEHRDRQAHYPSL